MISSWSTCHKILHILMFITSFGEQNITYKCCSNFLIHLCNAFLPYSNLTAIQTALIASGLASKFLLGEITQSSKVSWKGSPTDVINNGFELTDRYQAFTKPLEVLPLLNSGCDICNA